jgi:hypothetical protein
MANGRREMWCDLWKSTSSKTHCTVRFCKSLITEPTSGYTSDTRIRSGRGVLAVKPDRHCGETILSQDDIVKLQMVEALPEETSARKAKREIPDMSVGWYTSPMRSEYSEDEY